MIFLKNLSVFFFLIFLLFSCTENQRNTLNRKPNAFGNVNNVVVVADDMTLNSPPGDTLMYYLQAAYPILPQPEPLFDVRTYTPNEMLSRSEKKEQRTYLILADMSQENTPGANMVNSDLGKENVRSLLEKQGFGTKVVKNRRAEGQLTIYLFGQDEQSLLENVRRSFPGILQRIAEHDSNLIRNTTYFKGTNAALEKEIFDSLGVKISLPSNYKKAVFDQERNTYWLRYDEKEYTYNILLHKEEYKDKAQFSRENLIAVRDTIGQLIASGTPDSRMVVNDDDLPLYVEGTTLNGNFALKANGIWEIENDFMGGSFVSYLIHNPNTGELVMADGFLFAPGKAKREAMQQLENVLSTVKF